MKGDIALVGFVLTSEEWESLDSVSRAQLLAAAFQRDAPWVDRHSATLRVAARPGGAGAIVAPLAGMLSEPARTDDESR